MKLKCTILLLLTFLGHLVHAQNTSVAGIFPTIDYSDAFNKKLDYSFYYFGAFPLINIDKPDITKDAYFLLFYSEQALTYKATKRLSFTGSYVYQRAYPVYDNYVNENRFYLQATYKHPVKKYNFKHRLRFDGRFIQDKATNETPFTHRLRYLIGIDYPINSKLYVTAYEEAFFNTYKGASTVYAENWAYAAIGRKLNAHNKIEAGLLYLAWDIGNKNWFRQYYLQITWVRSAF